MTLKHYYLRKMIIFIGLALLIFLQVKASDEIKLLSPDGNIRFRIYTENERLMYSISFKNRPVIESSPMVMTVDNIEITAKVRITSAGNYKIDETYPWLGLHSKAISQGNGTKVSLSSGSAGTSYVLDIRVFNDAAAFRFVVPGADNARRVPDEATLFRIPAGSIVWSHNLSGHYEGIHVKQLADTIHAGQWAAPPVTIKLPDGLGYASVTEADLRNYSGMALQANGQHGFVLRLAHSHPVSHPYELRYTAEDIARLSKPAVVTGIITTPWRVTMIGADLNTLVNCDAIHSLCPPPDTAYFPKGIATSWIRPGRAVWRYLDNGGDNSLENMKEFCRKAGELGFEHHVIEGFWTRWTDDQIRELINYSNQYHVSIWFWKHSKSLRDSAERHNFFQHCHDLGVAGVKIDFFDHEAKEVIDLYQAILKETAKYHLLVNFHGANKPTGESRTWPNELTREAVKGMEASKLADRATHNTTLPFTRFLAGPADYTPGHFGERRKNTTWAHQIASVAILSSPLLTYAANPDNLLSNPAVDMIKSIPAVWDETRVLPLSEIGETVVYAQRKGNTWFLSVLNGVQPKTIKIPLSFLSDKAYQTYIVRDNKDNPASVKLENRVCKRSDAIEIELGEGGGFIAKFTL